MSMQDDFEKELFTLLKRYDVELQENFHTPHQQSAYELRVYDDENEEYAMIVEIDNSMIDRYESFLKQ